MSLRLRFLGSFIFMLFLLALTVMTSVQTQSDPRGISVNQRGNSANAEKRIALVIGNSNYNIGRLSNPANDARDIAAVLREVGFDVTLRQDLNQRQMIEEILAFGRKLRMGGVGLFYFAGHGIQVSGRNFLVPIDANIEREEDVEFEAVDAGRVLAEVAKADNNLNIIILDACRNNPFARSFRSTSQGLAYMSAPSGTIVAYSTAPGSLAGDGAGRNGLYTEELLKNILQPGLRIEDVFKRVRVGVRSKTSGNQVPWESVSLEGDFYFTPTSNPSSAQTIASAASKQENVDLQTYTETINGIGIEMVRVPAGKFLMGSPASDPRRSTVEVPQHEVSISSFYMGKYEVTQAQWRAVVLLPKIMINLNPEPSNFKGDNLPVETVSWDEANEFCGRFSRATGKTYRLPTEAEWEYAARAMTTYLYAGNLDEMAWYANNSGRMRLDADEIPRTVGDVNDYNKRLTDNGNQTHPVGTKQPNGFGLYDLHGNVSEWCTDWFAEDYYSQSPRTNPTGPSTGLVRVKRGAGWDNLAQYLRSANRGRDGPVFRRNDIGFRLVRIYK